MALSEQKACSLSLLGDSIIPEAWASVRDANRLFLLEVASVFSRTKLLRVDKRRRDALSGTIVTLGQARGFVKCSRCCTLGDLGLCG